MNNIKNKINLVEVHERFLNDPVITFLLKNKSIVLEKAVPSYILTKEGISRPIYTPLVENFLKQTEIELENYIKYNYQNLFL